MGWGLYGCARCRNVTITINKIELERFSKDFTSLGITWNWGLDGCARWRRVTITVAIAWNRVVISNEFKEFDNTIEFELGWLRAVSQGHNYN